MLRLQLGTISGMCFCSCNDSSCWTLSPLPGCAPCRQRRPLSSCLVYVVYVKEFLRFFSWQHLGNNVRNQKQICYFCAETSVFFKWARKPHLFWKLLCSFLKLLITCQASIEQSRCYFTLWFWASFWSRLLKSKCKVTLGISHLCASGYFIIIHSEFEFFYKLAYFGAIIPQVFPILTTSTHLKIACNY